ncbi:M43 family zinc metalloprotease [Rufibacter immobilis]|nr:M43 family zinc metalloprotease [Rufibacter immobilis]
MAQTIRVVLFLFILSLNVAVAQTRVCATMQHVEQLGKTKPNLRAQLQQQARVGGFKKQNERRALGGVITIPVVVHVVYGNAAQNISLAQIQSQIAVLNKDFRRLNADANRTPDLFKDVAADAEIEFKLAQRTPDGEPTTGITRTKTSVADFKVDDAMKYSAYGGKDAWDTEQYLNIWVVRLSEEVNEDAVLGYAQFPNIGSPETDGVVIDYRYFGTTGTAVAPFNLGRTTTHEVGHWLNLFHIWGDEECGDDQVADTPTQKEENTGCPSFPKASCNNTSDMFMNYMDYTNDACMNLFTIGQKDVMQQALTQYRPGILSSLGATAPVVPDLEAALVEVVSPRAVLCETSLSPQVVVRNRGSQTLTSLQIRYQLDNAPAQTYAWTGSIDSFQNGTISIPALPVALGQHTIRFSIISRNNSTTDANAANDVISAAFQVQINALPLQEGFEGTVFPPSGWTINNPGQDLTWARTTMAAKIGKASAFMRNSEYPVNGQVDELVLPPLDLSSRTSPKLTFQLAYALISEQGFSDTLEVWVSTNCGETYQRLYQKYDKALTTATPYFTEDEFVPTAAQWRLETIDLSAYASAKTALIKFRHVTDFENNLYLDDVKVDGTPLGAAEELAQQAVKVTPNPTTGVVVITSREAAVSSIQVCTALGQILQEEIVTRQAKGQPLELTLQGRASGLYIIKLNTDKGVVVRRVLLVR